MRHRRGVCVRCNRVRLITAHLGIQAYVVATGMEHLALNFNHPLCGHCSRKLGPNPSVNLASGGVRKWLTLKQKDAAILAHKRQEKRNLQLRLKLQATQNDV